MYHFKKKYFASCSSSSKLKPIDDEEASTSSAASSASNRGEFPSADFNERCVSPPIRTERGRSQTIYQDSGIRRTEGASFNHSLEGPFVATSSPQKRPQLWPPPVHPHPPHPLLLFPSPGHPYLHPQYIHPNYLLNSIPTLPVMQRVPEPDHSLLRHANLPDLIIEPIKEEQQSPRPPSSITTFGGNSSCSASSPRSPSGSNGRDGSTPPPAQGSRKRRRQDTLVPEGCPLNRRQIVDLAIDEFNELLEKSHFSEEQKAKFRDLRRKGKNRVAAKKSREKRISGIEHLKAVLEKKQKIMVDLTREHSIYKGWNANLQVGLEMAKKKREIQLQMLNERQAKQSRGHTTEQDFRFFNKGSND